MTTPAPIEPALLAEAARAFLRIKEALAVSDLRDWLGDAGREHHEGYSDRQWHARLNAGFVAGDFCKLTGCDYETAVVAIGEAMAPSWPTIACREIIEFCTRFIDPPAERTNGKPAPKRKGAPLC